MILLATTGYFANGQSKYLPKGVRVGANLVPIGVTLTNKEVVQYEVTGDISFYKYLLTVDIGQAKYDRQGSGLSYTTTGMYYKGGIDVNFLHNAPGNHVLGLGLRYARSDYKNEMSWYQPDELWGEETMQAQNDHLSSQWFEGLLVLKVNTWANIQLGFTGGLKFARSVKGSGVLNVYEIPGYGYAEPTSLWTFNYHIYYYIPFRK